MAVVRALAMVGVLFALACLPCVLPILISAMDEWAQRLARAIRRGVRRLARYRGLRWLAPPPPLVPDGPPIEQIAADLRRLSGQRLSIATRSPVWFTAVHRAYDDRLCAACRSLGVEEHLTELDGVDRDIERLRMEGELIATGLNFGPVDADRR